MPHVTFGRRLACWLVELLAVGILLGVGLRVGFALSGGSAFVGFLVALTAIWLYFAGLESSARQTTLSGVVLGTRVTDLAGRRITFGRATVRHFAMYASIVTPFALGFLMVLWTKRRQTLHDYLASTIVLAR